MDDCPLTSPGRNQRWQGSSHPTIPRRRSVRSWCAFGAKAEPLFYQFSYQNLNIGAIQRILISFSLRQYPKGHVGLGSLLYYITYGSSFAPL